MKRAGWRVAAVLAVAVALVSALASTAGARSSGEQRAAATIKIGIVYSRTGALAAYGAQYVSGLRWGLNYATKGTNKVGNNTIELTLVDDAGDPAKAVSAAKDLIGQGYKILAGSISSGRRGSDGTARRPEQHPLHLGPGEGRRGDGHQQEHLPLRRADVPGREGRELVPRLRRGQEGRRLRAGHGVRQGNYLAVKSVMGDLGGQSVDRVLVPFTATDFTPFVSS